MANVRDPEAFVGETLGNKYHVRRLIGAGGMGVVYEVEHRLTKRVGALKLLHRGFAAVESVVERFVREASAAGRIGNPHIVETFDAGELSSGEPYIFMELLSGHAVTELIRQRGALPLEDALEIVVQAAEGLAAAHAADIVHRDVKPDNLFLCRGETPFVKILDFGISKFAPEHPDQRLTAEGAPMGTPSYMSPEQVVGSRDVDARTDVYSLAVVLYECVTGRVPFRAESLPALSVKIFEGKYTAVSELVPEAPAALDAIITRAMAAKPEARYPDMQSFRQALLGLDASRSVSLAPTLLEPGAERRSSPAQGEELTASPPSRRARGIAAVFALVALGLAATAAVALWPTDELESSRRATPPLTVTGTPRVLAPPLLTSAATKPASEIKDGGLRAPPSVPRARPASAGVRMENSKASAPTTTSRAAKDGLSEQNPFND